ncbi:unnamed protein product [Citrullus colocynthis]|uniref:Uncharacterized protein n=1 Tax=Citrullus colocynthis TaxID=252529 RepID=A0ABP0ZG30_9ROSI
MSGNEDQLVVRDQLVMLGHGDRLDVLGHEDRLDVLGHEDQLVVHDRLVVFVVMGSTLSRQWYLEVTVVLLWVVSREDSSVKVSMILALQDMCQQMEVSGEDLGC